jgi:hypothetical protein
MFYRFFDVDNHGYLLGHIVSFKTKGNIALVLEIVEKGEVIL